MSGPPEGWYDDPDEPERQRWWDGDAWTEHRHGAAPSRSPGAPVRQEPLEIRARGTVRTGFGLAAGWALFFFVGLPILLIGGCGALIAASSSGGGGSDTPKVAKVDPVVSASDLYLLGNLAAGDVKANYHQFTVTGTTCKAGAVDRVGPDTWRYDCIVRMVDKRKHVHAFSKYVECFDPPHYTSVDSCTNSTGDYPKSLYKPKTP